MLEKVEMGDKSKFDGCLKTLPVSLSEMPDSMALRWFSNNSEMTALRSIWSDEPIEAEEEQQTFSGKLVKIKSRRDGVPWLRSGSGS